MKNNNCSNFSKDRGESSKKNLRTFVPIFIKESFQSAQMVFEALGILFTTNKMPLGLLLDCRSGCLSHGQHRLSDAFLHVRLMSVWSE